MGKRSEFERAPRDFYPTPRVAVERVAAHFSDDLTRFRGYIEPCAGEGDLLKHIADVCAVGALSAFDIEPGAPHIERADASDQGSMNYEAQRCRLIITNPPWKFDILSKLLDVWAAAGFTSWVLLSGDFAHNVQSAPYMRRCTDVVPIGRLKWIPDSKHAGKDNCAWYRFLPWPHEDPRGCALHPRES